MDINVIQVKESEFNATIQMYQANGYQIMSLNENWAKLQLKGFGGLLGHGIILILTVWWSFGIINIIYAGIRYIFPKEIVEIHKIKEANYEAETKEQEDFMLNMKAGHNINEEKELIKEGMVKIYQLEQTPETRKVHVEMDIINTAKKLKNLRNDVIELNNLEDCISYIKYIYD